MCDLRSTMLASAQVLRSLAVRGGVRVPLQFQCRAMTQAGAAATPSFQLVSYTYVADILEKRGPHREGHLAAARQKGEEGKLILAGAVGAPVPEGGMFVFRDTSEEDIKAFIETDPYFKAGLISSWSIKPYNVVVNALEK